jgi:hypothetical protein
MVQSFPNLAPESTIDMRNRQPSIGTTVGNHRSPIAIVRLAPEWASITGWTAGF